MAAPRERSVADILARMPGPDVEPRIRDLVKRPSVLEYRRVRSESAQDRIRHSFVLAAFVERLRERVRAAGA